MLFVLQTRHDLGAVAQLAHCGAHCWQFAEAPSSNRPAAQLQAGAFGVRLLPPHCVQFVALASHVAQR